MFSFISLPARYKRALSASTDFRSTTHIPLLVSLALSSQVYIARPSETQLVVLLLPQPPPPIDSLLLARHTSRKYFLASTNPFHQLKRTVSCCFVVDFPEPARKYPGECFSSRYRWLTSSVRSETWGGQQEHKSCAYLYVVPGISIPLQLQSREAGSGGEETEGTNVKGSPQGAMKRGR